MQLFQGRLGRAHGDDAGEFARGRTTRSRRFSGAGGYSRCARTDGVNLKICRILPAGDLSFALYESDDRAGHGRAESDGDIRREILPEFGGRNSGSARPDVQRWVKAIRVSDDRRENRKTGHGVGTGCRSESADLV